MATLVFVTVSKAELKLKHNVCLNKFFNQLRQILTNIILSVTLCKIDYSINQKINAEQRQKGFSVLLIRRGICNKFYNSNESHNLSKTFCGFNCPYPQPANEIN